MMKHVFASLRSYINKVNYLYPNQLGKFLCDVRHHNFVTFKLGSMPFSCHAEIAYNLYNTV